MGVKQSPALRIGLLGASTIFFNIGIVLWNDGQALVSALNLGLSLAAWVVGAVIAVIALLPSVSRRAVWLVLISFLALGLLVAYLSVENYSPLTSAHSDNEMIGKYALEALKRGQNPYSWNFSDIVRVYRDPGTFLTPFLDGTYQNRLTYPALPVLVLWVFDRVGLGQVRIVNLVFYELLMILLFLSAAPRVRPVILLPFLLLNVFTGISLIGAQDVVWSALLVAMILCWKRPIIRALLFGLASAFHQQPWFIAPFLLIYLWYEGGTIRQQTRRILLFAGISGGVFLLINLPFILMGLSDWVKGVVEPAYAAFNFYSQGLSTFSVYGMIRLPREFYTVLQFTFLAVALFIFIRHPRLINQGIWIFPAIFFWLYYRGLANYWIFWLPPFFAALSRLPVPRSTRSYRPAITAQWALLTLAVPIVAGFWSLKGQAPITATLSGPALTSYEGRFLRDLQLTLTNNDNAVFKPSFAVQHDLGIQALPWTIVSGPDTLGPGETGEYEISNDNFSTAAPTDQSAQVVVSDANGSYQRRALVTIQGAVSGSDLIANPDFLFWNDDGSLPINWTLASPVAVTATRADVAGRSAFSLDIQNTLEKRGFLLSKFTQRVTFPGAFSLWVYPTVDMSPGTGEVYGLEIDDGLHDLWILFGSKEATTTILSRSQATIRIPAPLNEWTRQTISLEEIYARLNWKPPPYSNSTADGQNYPARCVDLSLIASSNQNLETTWTFGAIEQDSASMSVNHMVRDALDHPADYYVYVGDQYRLQRNHELAVNAYQKALAYDANNAPAYFGLAWCDFDSGDFGAGVLMLVKALLLQYL